MAAEKYIIGFNVTVNNSHLMQFGNATYQLAENVSHLILVKLEILVKQVCNTVTSVIKDKHNVMGFVAWQ